MKRLVVSILALALLAGLALFTAKRARSPLPPIPDETASTTPSEEPLAEEVRIYPEHIEQGDALLVSVTGPSAAKSISLAGERLETARFGERTLAFAAIDLNAATGEKALVVSFEDGHTSEQSLLVSKRERPSEELGIPEKLGGNTPESQSALVSTLAEENAILAALPRTAAPLWSKAFIYPVEEPVVTDPYGFTRLTGSYQIAHKGADFRAPLGTKVLAMNSGKVSLAREFRNYGNTIVIDHGLGIETFYMHLSRLDVSAGQMVERGQTIGLSGESGYAAVPHLHLTVRVNGLSIDPVEFLDLFNNL